MVSMRKNKNGANFKSLYTANTVAALYSAQLGDSNELRLAAIGRYGDTPPYRYLKSHLTSGASVRPENAVTYSAGNEGQNICGVFSETAPLQRSSTPSVDGHTYSRPFFLRKAARMRIIVFTTCGGGPKRPFFPSSCAELKVVVSFVSCHWSCLQARSVHNVMLS